MMPALPHALPPLSTVKRLASSQARAIMPAMIRRAASLIQRMNATQLYMTSMTATGVASIGTVWLIAYLMPV